MKTESSLTKKDNAGALSTIDLRKDSGRGTQEIKTEDVSTPILKILHQLSPECNSRDPKYVEGAKPGMIYSGSLGIMQDGDKGINIMVAYAQMRYPEWQDMGDSPSAPVGTHMSIPADAKEEKGGRYRLPNGNYVEKTAYFYVLILVNEELKPAVIPMRSSNLTPARELNNLIKNQRVTDDKGSFEPASYHTVYNLKTASRTAGSKSWHVYKPTKVRSLNITDKKDSDMYKIAQQLEETVAKGTAKPKYENNRQSTADIV